MIEERRLFNQNRCDIFNFIIKNPGKHFSNIMRDLDLTKRALGYHLERLVEEGLVDVQPHGIFKFYYPAGYEDTSKKLTPMQQQIFEIIRETPCSTDELADVLGKSKRAVQYHLKNLESIGFIERKKMTNGTHHWYVE